MVANVNYIQPQALRTLGHASITNSYVAVGDAYTVPLRAFRIINNTNGDLILSTDSSVSAGQFFVPNDSFVLYDLTANSGPGFSLKLAAYTQFYVKFSTDPSSGDLYIEGIE